MTLLGLWELSIGLSAMSLMVMFGLIVARLFSEKRDRRLADRRSYLLPALLSGEVDINDVAPGGRCDAQTTDLLAELIYIVRGEERERFASIADQVGAGEVLRRRLSTGSVRVKVSAAEALAHFLDAVTTDVLDQALDDRSSDVRLAAALSLSQSGRAPPIRVLIDRLSLGQKENSLLLVTLLQRIVDERPEEIESLLLDGEVPEAAKAAAIEALAAAGRFQAAPQINRLALEASVETEELARYLRALGILRHPAGIPAVTKHLSARTWWVRAAAAEAAGRIGVEEVIPVLSSMLDDDDWWVRFRAGEALAHLGENGIHKLKEAASGASLRREEAARLTLAELGLASDA